MAFNIGQVVVPSVDMTVSGINCPTAGASGTVLDRKLIGRSPDSQELYAYYIDMTEDYPLVSGTTISNFWFEEYQLAGGTVVSMEFLDVGHINTIISSGQQDISSAHSNTQQVLQSMQSHSPYYDLVKQLVLTTAMASEAIVGDVIDTSTNEAVIKTAQPVSQKVSHLATSAKVSSEIADNAKGYYDVIEELNTQRVQTQSQVDLQNNLAREDTDQNAKAYYETYIETYPFTDLLAPTPGDAPVPPTTPPPDNLPVDITGDEEDPLGPALKLKFGNE